MPGLATETLGKYFPNGGLKELGFRGSEPGYIMPNGRLMAHYSAEVVRIVEGQEEPHIRRVLVVTNGQDWFVGARDGMATTSQMLSDMVEEGISKGKSERYEVKGEDLSRLLADPYGLPDIESPARRRQFIINTSSHSFE